MIVLDNEFIYQDGACIDALQIKRAETEQMNEKEEKEFWHHVGECKDCRNTMSEYLKNRKINTGQKHQIA